MPEHNWFAFDYFIDANLLKVSKPGQVGFIVTEYSV